jgi:hypothetical protein
VEFDPHVRLDDLEGHTDGLIALTGAGEGALTRLLAEGQQAHADVMVDRLQALFPGRLYVELARRGDAVEERAEAALIDLAYARDLPLVATNPANYAEPHMHKAHDAMLCIAGSTHVEAEDRAHSNPESYVKTYHMMDEGFADLPEAVENTLVVAQRCAYMPPYRKPILPSLAGDLQGEARMLEEDARKGLAERLRLYYPETVWAELVEALSFSSVEDLEKEEQSFDKLRTNGAKVTPQPSATARSIACRPRGGVEPSDGFQGAVHGTDWQRLTMPPALQSIPLASPGHHEPDLCAAIQARRRQADAFGRRLGGVEHGQRIRAVRRRSPVVAGEQARGVAVLAHAEQRDVEIAHARQPVRIRRSPFAGAVLGGDRPALFFGDSRRCEPGGLCHGAVAVGMIGREAAFVAVPDVPARIARAALRELGIQRARRGAAGQHQMERAACGDRRRSLGAQRIGQRPHQRIGTGEHPPLDRHHNSLRHT